MGSISNLSVPEVATAPASISATLLLEALAVALTSMLTAMLSDCGRQMHTPEIALTTMLPVYASACACVRADANDTTRTFVSPAVRLPDAGDTWRPSMPLIVSDHSSVSPPGFARTICWTERNCVTSLAGAVAACVRAPLARRWPASSPAASPRALWALSSRAARSACSRLEAGRS